MGLGFHDGFKPDLDPVVEVDWDVNVDQLLLEAEESIEYSYKQDTLHTNYHVVTSFGEEGHLPVLDKYAAQLVDIFGVRVGASYVIQAPDSYYMHHSDPVASAFFEQSNKNFFALKDFFQSDHSPEERVQMFIKICNYVYDYAVDRQDIFIGIKDRLYEIKDELKIINNTDITDEDIVRWRSISPRCCFNIQLKPDASPVNYTIDGISRDYHYKKALLNVDATHGIQNSSNTRIIARFVIYEKTFTEVYNIIRERKLQIH